MGALSLEQLPKKLANWENKTIYQRGPLVCSSAGYDWCIGVFGDSVEQRLGAVPWGSLYWNNKKPAHSESKSSPIPGPHNYKAVKVIRMPGWRAELRGYQTPAQPSFRMASHSLVTHEGVKFTSVSMNEVLLVWVCLWLLSTSGRECV